ncbi:MAG TPA: phosphatase PAP2 family protein [Gemmatimonadales bacterium]|jgi:membrane-associated phospholipid phosphatase
MRHLRIALIAIVAIVLAHLGDGWAYHHLARPDVYNHDWGRLFRSIGFLPLWLIAALALGLTQRRWRSALLLALVPTAGGLVCEVIKILVRRERPNLHAGQYFFRPFTDRFLKTTDFGMPSSHAMVAFSAAWVLCRLYPRAWPVWIGVACGCAFTRVEAQAHFLSDVTVGAVAAWFLVEVIWRRWAPVASEQAA